MLGPFDQDCVVNPERDAGELDRLDLLYTFGVYVEMADHAVLSEDQQSFISVGLISPNLCRFICGGTRAVGLIHET